GWGGDVSERRHNNRPGRPVATWMPAGAKKTRTPAPPRPVQAPQRRTGGKAKNRGGGDERAKWMLIAFAASGIVALAIVAAVVVLTSGSSDANAAAVPDATRAAGCTDTTVRAETRDHVQSLDTKIKYAT